MAVLDTDSGEIVLRVVYDGPPEAGKTTSLRSLAGSLSQQMVTPAEDVTGRTLWFDWMEYVGGRFEGSRIRCQIVSVPGQRALARRRNLLLRTADVVVFVGDSTPAQWETSIEYLFELRQFLAAADPPVGVVFQANKRDLPDAIGLDELRVRLGDARWSIGVVESIAADGTGIREAFVYAVRLALDRVREQMQRGTLEVGRPALDTPDALLAALQSSDAVPLRTDDVVSVRALRPRVHVAGEDSLAAQLFRGVLEDEEVVVELPSGGAPRPPDASVPSGAIWPPVEGRAILAEVSAVGLRPRALRSGAWIAGLGTGWRVVSARDAAYESLDAGRSALIQWARLHAACATVMSPRRCIVLAATGDGAWRLWQIVRAEESLRDLAELAVNEEAPELALQRLCMTAQLLADVGARLADGPYALPCSLDTIGQSDAAGVYIGLMPESSAPGTSVPTTSALLDQELGPLLAQLDGRRAALGRALEHVPRRFLHADAVIASLARMLA